MKLSLLTLVAPVAGENGIARVIRMLSEMKSAAETETQTEAVKFKEFQTWCTTTKTQLGAQLEKVGSQIDSNKKTVEAQEAKAREMGDKIEKNAAAINALIQDREAKKTARAADKKAYATVKADYETSVSAIENAIKVLKAQPRTVAQGSKNAALVQIMASSMTKKEKDLVSLLVTSGPPAAHAYQNQSGGVIGMLNDLKSQFIEELNKEVEAESKKEGATNTIVMSLNGQIENLEKEKKRFESAKAKHEQIAGSTQVEVESDSAVHEIDSKSVKEVTANCENKEKENLQRTTVRAQEIEAIAQAVDVIEGISNKKTAAGFVQEATSFIQIRGVNTNMDKVIRFLQGQGQRSGSKKLQLLALKISQGGPFDKILGMISDMIDRLKAETLEETGKFGECQIAMSESKSDLESSDEKMSGLKGTIDEQTGIVGTTKDKIKALSLAEKEAAVAIREATSLRASEKAENAQTVKDAKEGEEAIDSALQILEDFYSGAKKSALLQANAGPIDISGTPETFDGAYEGNQGGGSNVINLLEVIQADFLKLRSETESAESTSQAAYDEFLNESEMAKAERDSNLQHTKSANAAAMASLSNAEKDLGNAEENHTNLLEQKRVIEQEKGCLTLSNKTPDELFKERVEARNAEIEDLKNALEMLKR